MAGMMANIVFAHILARLGPIAVELLSGSTAGPTIRTRLDYLVVFVLGGLTGPLLGAVAYLPLFIWRVSTRHKSDSAPS